MIDDLVTLLIAQTFAGLGTSVFAEVLDQKIPLPFARCDGLTGTDHKNTLDGAGGTESAEADIVVKAATGSQAKTIGKLIKAFIRNYTGAMGTVTVEAVNLLDEYSGYESPVGGNQGRFLYTISVQILYK